MTAAGCRPGSLGQRVDLEVEECLCMGTRTAGHCPGRRETYRSSGSSSTGTGGDTRRRIPARGTLTHSLHTRESSWQDPAPLQGLAAKGSGAPRWSDTAQPGSLRGRAGGFVAAGQAVVRNPSLEERESNPIN